MTKDEIIEMAREAGIITNSPYLMPHDHVLHGIERFAALVAAAEREKVAAWMIQRGYATGHGDTTEDLLKELDWQVLENWSSAMKTGAENEREACAKVCMGVSSDITRFGTAAECVNAIRARNP